MKRAVALLSVTSAALAIAVSCDPIVEPTSAAFTANGCDAIDACQQLAGPKPPAGLACSKQGACTVSASPVFSLVVAVPQGNYRSPGMALALSPVDIPSLQKSANGKGCPKAPLDKSGASCIQIPTRAGSHGILEVDRSPAPPGPTCCDRVLYPPYGFQSPVDATATETVVPVSARLFPLWADDPQNPKLAARPEYSGLLLSGIDEPYASLPPTAGGQRGPFGSHVLPGYEGFSQATAADGNPGLVGYVLGLWPSPPFDSVMAPFFFFPAPSYPAGTEIDLARAPIATFTYAPTPDPPPGMGTFDDELAPFKFATEAGAAPLTGFRAYVVSRPSGILVSSVATLKGTPNENVTLRVSLARPGGPHDATADPTSPVDYLILEPPAGPAFVGTPRYEIPLVGLAGEVDPYPVLYPAITVKGTTSAALVDAEGGTQIVPVSSDLVFDSTAVVTPSDPVGIHNLAFRAYAQSDASGAYEVTLPTGTYDVWVTPHEVSSSSVPPLARTKRTLKVGPTPLLQDGKSFSILPRAHLRGRAILPSGTPVAGAEVVAEATADRFFAAVRQGAVDVATASLAWPRSAYAVTDPAGNYDLAVDPGDYDVTVRPPSGSHLPWTLSPSLSHAVGPNDGELEDVVVPVPAALFWQLVDDTGAANPIPGAVVTAYMKPPGTDVMGPSGKPLASRAVGVAVTDAQGLMQLYLPPCAVPIGGACP